MSFQKEFPGMKWNEVLLRKILESEMNFFFGKRLLNTRSVGEGHGGCNGANKRSLLKKRNSSCFAPCWVVLVIVSLAAHCFIGFLLCLR